MRTSDGKKHSIGFTLIEMMITVLIVGILSAVAIPQYTKYMQKARRADAQALLSEISVKQQQFLMTQRRYAKTADFTDLGISVPSSVSDYYTGYDTITVNGLSYTVSATPAGAQGSDECGVLTINSDGEKTAKVGNVAVSKCW